MSQFGSGTCVDYHFKFLNADPGADLSGPLLVLRLWRTDPCGSLAAQQFLVGNFLQGDKMRDH